MIVDDGNYQMMVQHATRSSIAGKREKEEQNTTLAFAVIDD
jgi:hypothetical protein